jgi:hypothetical protein
MHCLNLYVGQHSKCVSYISAKCVLADAGSCSAGKRACHLGHGWNKLRQAFEHSAAAQQQAHLRPINTEAHHEFRPTVLALLSDAACGRFVFKKAHLSHEDFRVFDHSSGHPVAVMHHFGKNPYGALDPLELSNISDAYDRVGVTLLSLN